MKASVTFCHRSLPAVTPGLGTGTESTLSTTGSRFCGTHRLVLTHQHFLAVNATIQKHRFCSETAKSQKSSARAEGNRETSIVVGVAAAEHLISRSCIRNRGRVGESASAGREEKSQFCFCGATTWLALVASLGRHILKEHKLVAVAGPTDCQ